MPISKLNKLGEEEAIAGFIACCNCRRWAERMAAGRPFAGEEQMHALGDEIWWSLGPEDWLEAFAGHPKIGDLESLRSRFAGTKKWAHGEQSAVEQASEIVLLRLRELNGQYLARFGYIFIVCATGKSAAEMLEILENRLVNDPDAELKIAAREQSKIMHLRLEKLCQEAQSQLMS